MATETIRRKGTKNASVIEIFPVSRNENSIWIFARGPHGAITGSIRAPIEKVTLSAMTTSDELRVGYYDFPAIASFTAGTVKMSVPIEIRNELIEKAVGYNGVDENIGQSGFCEMTTNEIEGEE